MDADFCTAKLLSCLLKLQPNPLSSQQFLNMSLSLPFHFVLKHRSINVQISYNFVLSGI